LDFGLAKYAAPHAVAGGNLHYSTLPTEDLTLTGVAVGTVPYMSPEQARGEQLDARTDLFSFGAVLYEMATGKRAFTGGTTASIQEAILTQLPPPASASNARIPQQLDRIIDKALEKDQDLRYQHASDLRSDLRRVQRDTGSGRHASAPASKASGGSRKVLYGLLAIAVFGAFALGWFERDRFAARIPTERQLTHNTPENRVVPGALSPDGQPLPDRNRYRRDS
jgi:serine/threonine protein kinase